MLTLFCTAKGFADARTAAIQRNAFTSWTLLTPRPEIVVFGAEEGLAEISAELGLRHVPQVACRPSGLPLVSDMFAQAQRLATNDLLCYVNADIILMDDFIAAVEAVRRWASCWLLIGARLDLEISEPLDFKDSQWQARLAWQARLEGAPMDQGSDYFVFPRGLFPSVPPFSVGRTAYDNWFIWWARRRRIPVADATSRVTAVHQGLNSTAVVGATARSPEGARNVALAGAWASSFTPADADFALGWSGPRRRRLAARTHRMEMALDLFQRPIRQTLRRLGLRHRHLAHLREVAGLRRSARAE
jgi:hypothetical protein